VRRVCRLVGEVMRRISNRLLPSGLTEEDMDMLGALEIDPSPWEPRLESRKEALRGLTKRGLASHRAGLGWVISSEGKRVLRKYRPDICRPLQRTWH
jgi:hypothetical protein